MNRVVVSGDYNQLRKEEGFEIGVVHQQNPNIIEDSPLLSPFSIDLPALITPSSLFQKRTTYSILEYEPLLDSSNMTMTDWVRIATDIERNYEGYDAFLVLHGTDTMAYTASALSFLLENLGKTVIVTGSQGLVLD